MRGGPARDAARAGAARGAVVLERRRAEGEDGGDEARARVMTKADVEAAAHGLWEMATDARARGAEDFHDAPEAFDAVVGLMEADESIVTPAARRYALAAAWSLAVSARGRAGLLAAEGSRARTTATAGAARWSRRLPRCWTRRARRWIGSRPRRLRKPPPRPRRGLPRRRKISARARASEETPRRKRPSRGRSRRRRRRRPPRPSERRTRAETRLPPSRRPLSRFRAHPPTPSRSSSTPSAPSASWRWIRRSAPRTRAATRPSPRSSKHAAPRAPRWEARRSRRRAPASAPRRRARSPRR